VLNPERHYASEDALQQPQASEERFMLPKTALHFFRDGADATRSYGACPDRPLVPAAKWRPAL
jgi:hypothetical protein